MATMAQCNRALKQLPDFARDQTQQTMDTTAFQVAQRASAIAPRRTGRLARGMGWRSRPRSLSAVVGITDPAAFYWKYPEYGTVKMPARPMFRPAVEALQADHDRRLISGLARALTQMERSV